MLRFFVFLLFLFSGMINPVAQPSIVGTWKTIDDNTGEAKSYVDIFEKDGKFYGKIVRLLKSSEDKVCDACPGEKKGKRLVGMEIIWDMEPYKDYWSGGRIMDPENGKTYKCNISLEKDEKLEVRGYVGFSALGRSQYWYRVK